jgi:predicted AlkP superfamily pyrophosphatase or phosphodiesterase
MIFRLAVLITLFITCLLSSHTTASENTCDIKLVLWITVDQLRGDLIERYRSHLGTQGFLKLVDGGIHYTNAKYQHGNTFTATGHATLFTGAHSKTHGMVGNAWFDRQNGKKVYCVEDIGFDVLDDGKGLGTSPKNLFVETVGDRLRLTDVKSKVFSISIKDRGAIIPGGHAGKAFWFSSETGKFTSSTYYYAQLPKWLQTWNRLRGASAYQDSVWSLSMAPDSYRFSDNQKWEHPEYGLSNTFPHQLGRIEDADYFKRFRYTPFADNATMELAKKLVAEESLGQGASVDFLAVSFSATDYIGHMFGPNSVEAEDNLYHLDQTIGELLQYIDSTIGAHRTLVVLSSDHGVSETPEEMIANGLPAGRLNTKMLEKKLNMALNDHFRCDSDLIETILLPNVFIDRHMVQDNHLDYHAVLKMTSYLLSNMEGIGVSVDANRVQNGDVSDTLIQALSLTYHAGRSGDLLIAPSPLWCIYSGDEAGMHGSPHSYDRHVPIIFYGPNLRPQAVVREVSPADIAPTVSQYLQIEAPSGSVGHVLLELFDTQKHSN